MLVVTQIACVQRKTRAHDDVVGFCSVLAAALYTRSGNALPEYGVQIKQLQSEPSLLQFPTTPSLSAQTCPSLTTLSIVPVG